jgi:DNA-binding NtrC family response regulator
MEGYEVQTAENGSAAFDEMQRCRYDLVLSDLKMPVMGGLELLEKIQETHQPTMTVIMTGFGTVESAIVAMKKGAYDYVLKPFKVEEVVQVVQRGLDQQRLRNENMQLRETVRHFQLAEALGGNLSIETILSQICDLTHKETDADAVQLVLEDPTRPGTFLVDKSWTSSHVDPLQMEPDVALLMSSFLTNTPVLL